MNDSELRKRIKQCKKETRFRVDTNLYIRVSAQLTPFWIFLYRSNNKQFSVKVGRYGNSLDEVTLAEAKLAVSKLRLQRSEGFDPYLESKRKRERKIVMFDHLAKDWLENECGNLKNPQIPARIYNKEIKKYIGQTNIDRVSGIDIRDLLQRIVKDGRKTIANDTLLTLKQIFNHGIRIETNKNNPAAAFSNKHAGGLEHARERFLSLEEVGKVFSVFRENPSHFAIENYIAVALLLVLGVRKTELTQAKWEEICFEKNEWCVPAIRDKRGSAITIPIPHQMVNWFRTLKMLSMRSEFIFPTRRGGNKGHISDDTLNHAVNNLFGKKTGKRASSSRDQFSSIDVAHFTIHDLRRTCRTLLETLKVSERVAEKCLNHKVKGIVGVYNHYNYFDERKIALQKLADLVFPLIDNPKVYITDL